MLLLCSWQLVLYSSMVALFIKSAHLSFDSLFLIVFCLALVRVPLSFLKFDCLVVFVNSFFDLLIDLFFLTAFPPSSISVYLSV